MGLGFMGLGLRESIGFYIGSTVSWFMGLSES